MAGGTRQQTQNDKEQPTMARVFCPGPNCRKSRMARTDIRTYCDCGRECVSERTAKDIYNKAVKPEDMESK
jgi:hypothetical protein